MSQRFSNCLKTEIHRDASEVYPLEVYERSASEVAFYDANYKYFNEILKSLASMEVPFYYKKGTLNDVVLSFYKKIVYFFTQMSYIRKYGYTLVRT